jgi:hypothetical protein
MIEVIADNAEFSSSNALMEWLAAVCRSRLGAHGGHALAGGTMARPNDRCVRRQMWRHDEFAAPGVLQNGAPSMPRQPMRQGIASRFRHIAPALLLC